MQNQTKQPRFGSPEYSQMMKEKNSQTNESVQKAESQKAFIPCDKLIIDENQPFRLYNDEELADLAARIKQSGLLHSIVVRPAKNGMYEILSGRNRTRAVMLNGDKEIEALIRDVGDDEAKMIMLNANLGQRESLLPSEKAKAYKMEADVLNRQGKRTDPTFSNNWKSYDARKVMAEKHSESKGSISNYIRLAYLHAKMLSLVDEKKLPLLSGVELSYLNFKEQDMIYNEYISKGVKPSMGQISALKALSKESNLNSQTAEEVFGKNKTLTKKEYIRFDKEKFKDFRDVFADTTELEQLFLDFLYSRRFIIFQNTCIGGVNNASKQNRG